MSTTLLAFSPSFLAFARNCANFESKPVWVSVVAVLMAEETDSIPASTISTYEIKVG